MAVWSEVLFSKLPVDIRLDAEYYQPIHLQLDKILSRSGTQKFGDLDGKFIVGPFGSAFLVENYVDKSQYRYVRGRDVKPFYLLEDDNAYISKTHFDRLKKYELIEGDLLISVVGTLGNVSIITTEVGRSIFSCKSTAYRSDGVDPYYLCAYLNSKIGQSYFQRMPRGHVQTGLNLPDLKNIPIFLPAPGLITLISDIVRRSYKKHQEAKTLYRQAELLLLQELGLSNFDVSDKLFYVRSFSELFSSRRMDAEFYKPKYYKLIDRFKEISNHRRCADIASFSKPLKYGSSDKLFYQEVGIPFLRIADLQSRRFDLDSVLRISPDEAMGQEAARVKSGDVLISRSGTLGIAVPIPSEFDKAVFGSYFIRVRPDPDVIHPEYLALYINSLCGSLQVERLTTGGVQTNLTIPAIGSIIVVIGDIMWQQQFVDKINKSLEAQTESKNLLVEAQQKVEALAFKSSN